MAGSVPILQLSSFLRSVRIVGVKLMELEDWTLQPLSEVGLLELLMQAWGKSRTEDALRLSVQELNAPNYDHLDYEQFEAVLLQIAVQTFFRSVATGANSFISASDKVCTEMR